MKSFLDQFIHHLQADRKLSANTVASYERDLIGFIHFVEQENVIELKAVKQQHIAAYRFSLMEQGRKNSTLSRHLVSIRSFFHYLASEGVVLQNPAAFIESPKQELKSSPNILTIDDINALLEAPFCSNASGKRDKAMLELIYASGIRVSELVSLNIEHVNVKLGFVQCINERLNERIIPIGKQANLAVHDYLESGREALLTSRDSDSALFLNHLGTRLTRQGFWKTLKKYAKAAGIIKEITPQMLRQSVAAHMLDNGADIFAVKEMMGHADISTTLKYTQASKQRMREAYSKAHPRA